MPSIERATMVTDPRRREREAEKKAATRAAVLEAAISLASDHGLSAVTRAAVARASCRSLGTVNYAYLSMDGLRDEVMRQAITRGHVGIIAQGLAAGSEIARNAPPDLKEAAAASLSA